MRILLHICCAPCAVKPIEALRVDGHEVVGYWFNPNIHPFGEWKKRRAALVELSEIADLRVLFDDRFDLVENLRLLIQDPEFGKRCLLCYRDRLRETANAAKAGGFDAFTTTLLYSKYQNHEALRRIAAEASGEFAVDFHYVDFRPLWGRGITASKRLGLYRQRWCGCIFSEFEAERDRENRLLKDKE